MNVFRVKSSLFIGLAVVAATVCTGVAAADSSQAHSSLVQSSATTTAEASRDASFLPPVALPPVALPTVTAPSPAAATAPEAFTQPAIAPNVPVVPTAPMPPAMSAPVPVSDQRAVISPPVITTPPLASLPTSTSVPTVPTVIQPAEALPISAPTPIAPTPAIGPTPPKTVEASPLAPVDPQSVGLLAKADGGLGADMWKGTSLAAATKLFTALNVPTSSAVMNRLALRLLASTAAVPQDNVGGGPNFTALRIEKLLQLGDADSAWKLAQVAKPETLDDITLRLTAEAALVASQPATLCDKLPDLVKIHTSAEWQKLMVVCQLIAKDNKAAQLTLDLLHAQEVKDDIFFYVAEKNIIGGNKQLPRQLTPLKALTLAMLRLMDSPLPNEVYTRPDATLIPALLASKAREDAARLGLAERASERGLIMAADLAMAYQASNFTPDNLANAVNSPEQGARQRALLYQAAVQEKTITGKLALATKFLQGASSALLASVGGQVLVNMMGMLPAGDDSNTLAASVARMYVMAGHKEAAQAWLKQARKAAIGMPPVLSELRSLWPYLVVAGLEPDSDYDAGLGVWLDAYLSNTDTKNDARARREQASGVLLLLEAAGFAVPEDAWLKVLDSAGTEKRVMPSALLLTKLRAASTSPRRAETVLLALALVSNNPDIPVLSQVEVVRALRMAGLPADATMLAREAVIDLLDSRP